MRGERKEAEEMREGVKCIRVFRSRGEKWRW
jgi:hypothetical protein